MGKMQHHGNEFCHGFWHAGDKPLVIHFVLISCLKWKDRVDTNVYFAHVRSRTTRLLKHVAHSHHIRSRRAWYGVCNKTFTSILRLMVHTLYHCKGRPQCPRYFWFHDFP